MFTDNKGRLRPAWAFVFSVLLSGLAFFICSYFAASITGDHVLRFETIFRSCLAGLLLVGFSWLLAVGNHVEEHRIAAQGLPLAQGWLRQLATGCGLGFGLGFGSGFGSGFGVGFTCGNVAVLMACMLIRALSPLMVM